MLINDFYKITDEQAGDNVYTCKVVFDTTHDIFKGHFPAQPVVPGVCMLQIVKELLQMQTGKQLLIRNAGNVKFLQLITPNVEPTLNISWQQADNAYKVNAAFKANEAPLFKMDGHFEIMS